MGKDTVGVRAAMGYLARNIPCMCGDGRFAPAGKASAKL